jgi:hypothetical protein
LEQGPLGPDEGNATYGRVEDDGAPGAPLQVRLVAGANAAFPLQGAAGDLLVAGAVADNELPGSATGELKLEFSDKALRDLWVAVQWAKQ